MIFEKIQRGPVALSKCYLLSEIFVNHWSMCSFFFFSVILALGERKVLHLPVLNSSTQCLGQTLKSMKSLHSSFLCHLSTTEAHFCSLCLIIFNLIFPLQNLFKNDFSIFYATRTRICNLKHLLFGKYVMKI